MTRIAVRVARPSSAALFFCRENTKTRRRQPGAAALHGLSRERSGLVDRLTRVLSLRNHVELIP